MWGLGCRVSCLGFSVWCVGRVNRGFREGHHRVQEGLHGFMEGSLRVYGGTSSEVDIDESSDDGD